MENLLNYAAMLALVAFIILAIVAIGTLRKAGGFIERTEKSFNGIVNEFKEINGRVIEAADQMKGVKDELHSFFDDMAELRDKASLALDEVKELKDKSIETLHNSDELIKEANDAVKILEFELVKFSDVIRPFGDLSRFMYKKIAPPMTDTANYISAINKAVKAFGSTLTRKK